MNKINKTYLLTGVTMLVVAAVLMIYRHILGDSTTGFAQVLMIIGICFTGASTETWGSTKKTQ